MVSEQEAPYAGVEQENNELTAADAALAHAAKVRAAAAGGPYDKRFNLKYDGVTFLMIVVVCFIQTAVLSYFYEPYHFLSGGVTGVAMLVDYLTPIPKWVMMIALNLPIAAFGVKHQGWKFVIFSLIATLLYSLFFALPVMHRIAATGGLGEGYAMLSAVVGAAIIGVTGAPIVKRGATLGGIDVISIIISRKLSIQIGSINICFNLIIMTVLGFFYGIQTALLSMVAMFVCNTAFNFALRGVNHTMSVFIISEEWDEIAPHVMQDMHRGVTYIHAEGAYTGQPRKLVYCLVKTTELARLKKIVKDHDPNALFSVIETTEVVGRGFGSMN